jgi:hypothetical protein
MPASTDAFTNMLTGGTDTTDTSSGNFSLDSILSGDYLTSSSYLPSSSGDTTLPTLTTPYTAPYTPTTSTSGTFDPGFDPATFATSGAAQTATNALYNSLYGTGGTLSGATGTGATGGGTTTGGGAAANPFGGLLSSALNYGVPLAWAADQKATNAKNIQPLKDIGTSLTKQGQDMMANYQNLSPTQQKALDQAIQSGQLTASRGQPLIDIGNTAMQQYQAGNLPQWQQLELDQKVAQQKALARQSLGANVDSTTLAQMDSQIDAQAAIAKGQMIQSNLATGEAAYGQGVGYETTGNAAVTQGYRSAVTDINQNLSNAISTIGAGLGPLESAIQMQIQGDTAITNSLMQMYSALAKAAGTAAAGGGAAGGGAGGGAGGAAGGTTGGLAGGLSSLLGGAKTGGSNLLGQAAGALGTAKTLTGLPGQAQNLYNSIFGTSGTGITQQQELDSLNKGLQPIDTSALQAGAQGSLDAYLASLGGGPSGPTGSITTETVPDNTTSMQDWANQQGFDPYAGTYGNLGTIAGAGSLYNLLAGIQGAGAAPAGGVTAETLGGDYMAGTGGSAGGLGTAAGLGAGAGLLGAGLSGLGGAGAAGTVALESLAGESLLGGGLGAAGLGAGAAGAGGAAGAAGAGGAGALGTGLLGTAAGILGPVAAFKLIYDLFGGGEDIFSPEAQAKLADLSLSEVRALKSFGGYGPDTTVLPGSPGYQAGTGFGYDMLTGQPISIEGQG